MKRIKLYINVSLDGFISNGNSEKPNLPIAFLNQTEIDREFMSFYNTIDTLIIGGNTYKEILLNEFKWPFKYKVSFIVTRKHIKKHANEDIRFISDDIIKNIVYIKKNKGSDIWLLGGGQLTSTLLQHNLIDEITLLYIPVLLSEGVPLFPKQYNKSEWELTECHFYETGVIKSTYKIKHE